MKRRMPLVDIGHTIPVYSCPQCHNVISRNNLKYKDECLYCGISLNRVAETMLKCYSIFDKDLYDYFISEIRKGNINGN